MSAKPLQVTVKGTGELLEADISSPEAIMDAWINASNYIKAYEKIKDQLKLLVPGFVDGKGCYEHNGYMFRQSQIQRMNYDKTILRQVIRDEDTFDLLLAVDKKAVDNYLKEHLQEVGIGSTLLRESMVPVGKPYTVVKLEKL